MTALTEFQRLESGGAWRAGPGARLRDVVVSVGDATLILSDPKSEQPLAHWSLPAITRLNPGQMPAVFAPGADDTDEQLELDDTLMIDAIGRVQRAIAARQAHPGRLRGGLVLLGGLAMLLAAALWLPGATIRYAARIAPPVQQKLIGTAVMQQMERSSGTACASGSGQAVLDHLTAQLLGPDYHAQILPVAALAQRLPGGRIILGRDLIENQPDPQQLAAHLLAARLAQTSTATMLPALRHIGIRQTLQLMTSGRIAADALNGYGEWLMSQPAPRPAAEALRAELSAHHLSADSFTATLDPARDAALIAALQKDAAKMPAADPSNAITSTSPPDAIAPGMSAPSTTALLTDQQWLVLQQICAP